MCLVRFPLAMALAAALMTPASAPSQEGGLSPESLFQRLDKNRDGKLTADEISDDQKRFFDRTLRVGDKNDDGVLTRDEFLQANKPQDNPSVPLTPPPDGGSGDRLRDLRQRFEMLDRNKDGKVTRDEIPEPFRERMTPLFERLGKDEINLEEFGRFGAPSSGRFDPSQMFQRMDTNSDGKITKDELPEPLRERFAPVFERLGKDELTREDFADAIRRLSSLAEGSRTDGPMGGRPPAFFRIVDANSDGRISKDELAKAADKFSELDRNEDGQIDPGEFFGGRPPLAGDSPMQRPEGARPERSRNPFFARMDANGDGRITKEEAPERLKQNFDRMDTDGDGALTQDELRAAFERSGDQRPDGDRSRPERPQPQ